MRKLLYLANHSSRIVSYLHVEGAGGDVGELPQLYHGPDVGNVQCRLCSIGQVVRVSQVQRAREIPLLHVKEKTSRASVVECLPVQQEEHDVLHPVPVG